MWSVFAFVMKLNLLNYYYYCYYWTVYYDELINEAYTLNHIHQLLWMMYKICWNDVICC
ncbi:unnamed protein product [Schistosoma mattheei]|uniref:Uncharacterized protein n=1 Tax=Schistosoma mattheei TaxID=31246 RepID=A0A183PEL1_9TREM|nr:unnamed protein product [Schistosoma mattheei]